MRVRWLVWVGWGLMTSAAACATGTDEEEGGGAPSGPAATVTTAGQGGGATGAGGGATTTTTTGQGGMGAGGPTCDPPEKLCGGICVGNNPETGCSGNVECLPCPTPSAHGMATCTMAGACALDCDQGYMASGSDCVCATECCDASDCGSSEVCADGTCETDCSLGSEAYAACTILCFAMNKQCRTDGVCECQ